MTLSQENAYTLWNGVFLDEAKPIIAHVFESVDDNGMTGTCWFDLKTDAAVCQLVFMQLCRVVVATVNGAASYGVSLTALGAEFMRDVYAYAKALAADDVWAAIQINNGVPIDVITVNAGEPFGNVRLNKRWLRPTTIHIDWRELLIKYMGVVIDSESVAYVEHSSGFVVDLTAEEKRELLLIEQEARKRFDL